MPYTPTHLEFVITGAFGIALYGVIGFQAGWLVWRRAIKLQTSKLFFVAIIAMALLEMPRFIELAFTGEYLSRVCYCFHILAGTAFFVAFSVVAHQWSGLLSMASFYKAVYGFQGLVSVNAIFAIVDVLSIGMCLASPTLNDYFLSPAFEIITLIEALRNLAYCGILAYFGVTLVCRFVHYASIDSMQASTSSQAISNALSAPAAHGGAVQGQVSVQTAAAPQVLEEPTTSAFHKASMRLSGVLVVATLCYVLRAVMLVAKVAIIRNERHGGSDGGSTFFEHSSSVFPLFGFLWFTCTDFLPRGMPSIVFMALMAKGRGTKRQGQGGNSAQARLPSNASSFLVSSMASTFAGSSMQPSFSLGRRGFFAGYSREQGGGSCSGDEEEFGSYEDEEFQFVQLAGDEARGVERARSMSQELRGELSYLTDDDEEEETDLDEVLMAAAFSQGQQAQPQAQSQAQPGGGKGASRIVNV